MATEAPSLTFAEHIYELRRRLMWSLLFVVAGAGVGYALHDQILVALQQPLSDSLYYTAPTGAFSFIIKVCIVFGLVVALPIVVYQAFAFFGPLLPNKRRRAIVSLMLLSVMLAAAGIAFAYFISLPAALHFLVNFGGDTANIEALITADEYFNFVLAYIAGFAALFQLPLIIAFINKVTPLKPSQLLGGTRYVILGSFVAAAIITPTPDPLNQALMAGPIIVLYFVSIVGIMLANALRRSNKKQPKPAVPDLPVMDVNSVLADAASLEAPAPTTQLTQPSRPAVLQQKQASAPKVRPNPSARPKLVTDMVVPREQRPVATMRPVQPMQQRATPIRPEELKRRRVNMGVISDFIPASD